MSHIFISYARKDIDFADKIVQALAENDMDTCLDWKRISKAEDWGQESIAVSTCFWKEFWD